MASAAAGWVSVIGGALVLTSLLSRRGHRNLCQVARTPLGLAAGIVINVHVFCGWRRLMRRVRVPR